MKKYYLIYLGLFFIYGCGGHFLQKETIEGFKAESYGEDHTVYFKKICGIDEKGRIVETTHKLLKLSDDIKNRTQSLDFAIGSMDELDSFHARLIDKDGSSKSYDKGDLMLRNTSSRGVIHERTDYSLPLADKFQEGEFAEFVYSVRSGFPALGFSFSPAEAGRAADNVCLEIIVPQNFKINYKSVNGTVEPVVTSADNITSYSFQWKDYEYKRISNPFEKLNNEPEILASFSQNSGYNNSLNSWREFGNWYLDIIKDKIEPGDEIKALAQELTAGISDPKEKLDAIFNYCQKNIRYEQVYIQGGEFIPNDCSSILKRKFGDCKDYSAIIYALAKCAGVNASLALCHRGRGVEFFDIPVSQFNHAIVYFSYNGKDFWYDGTNRISEPGLTTFDLANQTALVIEKDNSRTIRINENESNLFTVAGTLKEDRGGFLADLKLSFTKQYAIDFLYPDIFLNSTDMRNYITYWLKENLSDDISVSEMKWNKPENGTFEIILRGKLPNSFTEISPAYYTSFGKIFPELFFSTAPGKNDGLFYFPKFNRINIMLEFPAMQTAEAGADHEAAILKYSYRLPLGPFLTDKDKKDFIEKYSGIYSDLHKKIKLINRTAK
ncbi:MAG: transglutaminase-like domain-containing protein [Syntrophomonadaceae bacterium]